MPLDEDLPELLALLAHDLKNPLAAVVTNLAFVRSHLEALGAIDPDSNDAREATIDAQLASDALQRFVGNLELLAREAARATRPPPDGAPPLDLLAVADEAAGRQRDSAVARRLVIALEGPRVYVRADRDLVLRVADNLIANALQYAPAGSTVTLLVTPRGESEVELVVRDDGVVVPEPMRDEVLTGAGQPRIKGRADGRYGRGLALFAAAIAARGAGGRLTVETREGKSALVLALPRHVEDELTSA